MRVPPRCASSTFVASSLQISRTTLQAFRLRNSHGGGFCIGCIQLGREWFFTAFPGYRATGGISMGLLGQTGTDTTGSNSSGGGCLILFGVLVLVFAAASGSTVISRWRTSKLLIEHGHSVPAGLLSVNRTPGSPGLGDFPPSAPSTKISYRFKPDGSPEIEGTVVLDDSNANQLLGRGYFIGKVPKDYSFPHGRPMVVYLPENPSRNRLVVIDEPGSPVVAGICLSVIAAVGIGILICGARMIRGFPAALLDESVPLPLGRPVPMGYLTYTPHAHSALCQPSLPWLLTGFCVVGLFALMTGFAFVFTLAASIDMLFGWNPLGLTGNNASGPRILGVLSGVLALGFSVVPGLLFALTGGIVVNVLRFRCFATVFDFGEGAFRRGGRTVCRLSDIVGVHLQQTRDQRFPDKIKLGIAVTMRDGCLEHLDPRFAFQDRIRKDSPYTDLGEIKSGPHLEVAQRAAVALAAQLGVPLRKSATWGDLSHSGGK